MKMIESFLEAVVETPEEYSDDQRISHIPVRARKDSGYSETSQRPNYNSKPTQAGIDIWELQASLMQIANADAKSVNNIRSRDHELHGHCTRATQKPHQGIRDRPISNKRSVSSSTTSSSVKPISHESEQHTKHKACNPRSKTISPGSIESLAHTNSKTYDMAQSREIHDFTVSSREIIKPTSSTASIESSSRSPSRDGSASSTMKHFESYPEIQSSPMYLATNIDWTDPATRMRLYDKHDRGNRGVRRWLRKLTPKPWRGERLDFYDGNSDTGSVRRYRLDI